MCGLSEDDARRKIAAAPPCKIGDPENEVNKLCIPKLNWLSESSLP
jgi:hypothetical protein